MGEDGAVNGEGEVLPLVRKVLVGPYLPHHLHRLPEQFPVLSVLARVRVGVELRALIGPDSPAEADLHATAGHVVQDRQVFGKTYGVPPRGDVRHLPDAYPGGAGRQVGAQQDRVRQVADPVGAEVVLSEPDGLETQFLGQDGLLPEVADHLLGVDGLPSGSCHRRECRESHSRDLPFDPALEHHSGAGNCQGLNPVHLWKLTWAC